VPSIAYSRAAAWVATLASPGLLTIAAAGRLEPIRISLVENWQSEVKQLALRHEAAADAGAPAPRTN